jgi:hypothetical protein
MAYGLKQLPWNTIINGSEVARNAVDDSADSIEVKGHLVRKLGNMYGLDKNKQIASQFENLRSSIKECRRQANDPAHKDPVQIL